MCLSILDISHVVIVINCKFNLFLPVFINTIYCQPKSKSVPIFIVILLGFGFWVNNNAILLAGVQFDCCSPGLVNQSTVTIKILFQVKTFPNLFIFAYFYCISLHALSCCEIYNFMKKEFVDLQIVIN